jgi:hypothetical protein
VSEIACKNQRRIEMRLGAGPGLARFPFVRDLAGFDFAAQPSLDTAQIRERATGLFIAHGEAVPRSGPQARDQHDHRAELARGAGIPAGVLQILTGPGG